jgi:hypothetical protein
MNTSAMIGFGNDPEYQKKAFALRLISAHFGGQLPEMLTFRECVELMLKFGELESSRADAAMDLIHSLNAVANRPIILKR